MSDESSPTHATTRITELTFGHALQEGPRVFRGMHEVGAIWNLLIEHNVDPSFALGHFWVESNFGTAGWNLWSQPRMQSWGNILYPNSQVTDLPGVTVYNASNGFEYTSYPNWTVGVLDYCLLLEQYRDQSPDPRYGDTATIGGATSKWAAKDPDSVSHLNYLDIVLGRMTRYDSQAPWSGEMAIYSRDINYSTNKRYAIAKGDRWYLEPNGKVSYPFSAAGSGYFFGQVAGTSWFALRVNTGRLSEDGKTRPLIGFLPNFDPKKVSTV